MIFSNFFSIFRILLAVLTLQLTFITPSHAKHFNLVDAGEYNIELYSSNYDKNPNIHRFLLKISLKDQWQIFARNQPQDRIQPVVSLSSPHANVVKITWPEPILNAQKDGYVYADQIFVPITLRTNTSYDSTKIHLMTNFVLCKNSCFSKNYSFDLDIPGKDYDIASYELIKAIDTSSKHSIHHGLLFILLLSFIGGLILNVMPCVLPVISLKAMSLTNGVHIEGKQNHFAAMAAGNIIFFMSLGLIIAFFKSTGQHLGLGFSFQYPNFIISITLLMILFSVMISDKLHFALPPSLQTFFHRHSESTKLFGSFLSGAFAALMATPCTAPFLGLAISLSLTLVTAQTLLCFMFMGIGMSMPFILFATFPGLIKFLPSSGPWMIKLKKILVLGLYATTVWLIWILYSQMGLFAAIALFLSALLLKFFLERNGDISRLTQLALIVITVIAAYVLPANSFNTKIVQEQTIEEVWKPFSISEINQYIKHGKIVIVDITADWCLTCKYNKTTLWDNPFFLKMVRDNPQIIALRGDYTKGNKDINKFLKYHAQYGIPFSIVFSNSHPQGIALPTLANMEDVKHAIKIASKPRGSLSTR